MVLPDRGNLVWLDFSPQAGNEHRGRRPALVLSPIAYHRKTPLTVVCPITSKIKGYPFEVRLPEGLPIQGVVLADQIKSIDRDVHNIHIQGRAPEDIVEEVQLKLAALLRMKET